MLFSNKYENADYIGWWQLKNLIENRVPFIFLDLSRKGRAKNFLVDILIKEAVSVEVKDILSKLSDLCSVKEQPIVLLCENGKVSTKVAKKIYENNYINICVVDGGYEGLCEEAIS